eukprot:1212109-Pleurochrysis_carterae.AAC.1
MASLALDLRAVGGIVSAVDAHNCQLVGKPDHDQIVLKLADNTDHARCSIDVFTRFVPNPEEPTKPEAKSHLIQVRCPAAPPPPPPPPTSPPPPSPLSPPPPLPPPSPMPQPPSPS